MTSTGTNKKDLLQLCSQLKDSVNQLQRGIAGRRKRNRKSGASGRSRKTQKRKVAAAASANALANVRTDDTAASANTVSNVRPDDTTMTNSDANASSNFIPPSPVKHVSLIKEATKEQLRADKAKEDAVIATEETQNEVEEQLREDKAKEEADIAVEEAQKAVEEQDEETQNEVEEQLREDNAKEDADIAVEETQNEVEEQVCADKAKEDAVIAAKETQNKEKEDVPAEETQNKKKEDTVAEAAQITIEEKERADKEKVDVAVEETQNVVAKKAHADNEKEDVAAEETQNADEEKEGTVKEKEDDEASAAQAQKSSNWTSTEFEKLARSLFPNGSSTTYDTMCEHVLTRTKSAVKSYYNIHKKKLLRDCKKYAKNDIDNDYPVEDGVDDDGGVNLTQNIEVGPSIDTDKVIARETVYTLAIIEGAMARDDENHTVFLATFEDLNEFVQCFFAEVKEQVQLNDKDVCIAGVGTFRKNNNGDLVIIDQP